MNPKTPNIVKIIKQTKVRGFSNCGCVYCKGVRAAQAAYIKAIRKMKYE